MTIISTFTDLFLSLSKLFSVVLESMLHIIKQIRSAMLCYLNILLLDRKSKQSKLCFFIVLTTNLSPVRLVIYPDFILFDSLVSWQWCLNNNRKTVKCAHWWRTSEWPVRITEEYFVQHTMKIWSALCGFLSLTFIWVWKMKETIKKELPKEKDAAF